MDTSFSHLLRVLICPACGAATQVQPEGGATTCDVCAETSEFSERREPTAAATPLDETLRELPDDLAELCEDGRLAPDQAPEAMRRWQRARADGDAQRLYLSTRLLAERLALQDDALQLRAVLESALERLAEPALQQELRCRLAHHAIRAGDLAAADDWLAPCREESDPEARDAVAWSTHRTTAAYLALHRRRPERAIALLGARHGDLPLVDPIWAAVLRATALEQVEDPEIAARDLARVVKTEAGARPEIERLISDTPDLMLCRHCWAPARLLPRRPQEAPRPRPRLLASLPWVLLSLLFFVLAIVSKPALTGGRPLDLFFVIMGVAFMLPVLIRHLTPQRLR